MIEHREFYSKRGEAKHNMSRAGLFLHLQNHTKQNRLIMTKTTI